MCGKHLFADKIHPELVYKLFSQCGLHKFSTASHEGSCIGKDSSSMVDELAKIIKFGIFF